MSTRAFILPASFLLFFVQSASGQSNLRIWSESSAADFSDGQLSDLIVTSVRGGEVQLPAPLQKTMEDTPADDPFRFAARNDAGIMAVPFNSGGSIFLRMYNADGTPRTGNLLVSRTGGPASTSSSPRAALFNDGTCLVTWTRSSYEMRGQILANDTVLVDTAFVIEPASAHASPRAPVGFANESDQTFWIFYDLVTPSQSIYLYVQKRDKGGRKYGERFELNSDRTTMNELTPAIARDPDGLVVAWAAGNGLYAPVTELSVLLRKYDNAGAALSPIIKASHAIPDSGQFQPSLCRDDQGNLLVVWDNFRLYNDGSIIGSFSRVYGQLFSPALSRIGATVRLSSSPLPNEGNACLNFAGGGFPHDLHRDGCQRHPEPRI